ncbi:MAG: hypothetical protein QM702_05310 [Rubrivivax sp.]
MLQRLIALATLAAASLLAGCAVTLNGVTVPPTTLQKAKSIAVVSVLGDTVRYTRQGFIQGDTVAFDVPDWGLDGRFADLYAEAITRSLGIAARPYHGPLQKDLLRTLYVRTGVTGKDLPDWDVAAPQLRAIVQETQADLLAVVVRDWTQSPAASTQFVVEGLGFTGDRRLCASHANMLVVLVDGRSLAPVAGASLSSYDRRSLWHIPRAPLPREVCTHAATGGLSPQELDIVHRNVLLAAAPEDIEQAVKRLVKKPR